MKILLNGIHREIVSLIYRSFWIRTAKETPSTFSVPSPSSSSTCVLIHQIITKKLLCVQTFSSFSSGDRTQLMCARQELPHWLHPSSSPTVLDPAQKMTGHALDCGMARRTIWEGILLDQEFLKFI